MCDSLCVTLHNHNRRVGRNAVGLVNREGTRSNLCAQLHINEFDLEVSSLSRIWEAIHRFEKRYLALRLFSYACHCLSELKMLTQRKLRVVEVDA